jgi:hypothetical protein
VEFFEDLRWWYDSDPRSSGAHIVRMDILAPARRHCLDCGRIEGEAG